MCSSDLHVDVDVQHQTNLLTDLERLVTYFVTSFLHSCNPPLSSPDLSKITKRRLRLLPPPTTARTPLTCLRIAYAASLSHECITTNNVISKRDVYYLCRQLFPKETLVDTTLKCLASIVNVDRNDLNIVAAAKGFVAGRVVFVEESGCRVDVSMFGSQGCLIPARPDRMSDVSVDAIAVLVYVQFFLFHTFRRYYSKLIDVLTFYVVVFALLLGQKGLKRKPRFNPS